MKRLIVAIVAIVSMTSSFADTDLQSKEVEVFKLKQDFEKKAFELKVEKEKKQIAQEGKIDFDFQASRSTFLNKSNGFLNKSTSACAEWVYRGPGTREEALEACRGVRSMACVEWVYQGPGSRMDAARACRRIYSIECAQWVYKGPGSRIDALMACRGVRDMSCVEWVYQGPGSRMEAARACSHGGGRPGHGSGDISCD